MHKITKIIGLSILFLFVLNFSIGRVVASDDDGDSIDDSFEDRNGRVITVNFTSEGFEFESVLRRNGTTKDKFEIEIVNDTDGLKLEFEYTKVNGSTEMELEIEIEFEKIIEFEDLNDDGFYNKSEDNKLYTYDIDSFQKSIYRVDTTPTGKVHNVIVNTTDGNFTAYFHIVEDFSIVNDTLITPAEVKMDIEISNFTYTHPNSKLALPIEFEVEEELEEKSETEDEKHGYTSVEEEGWEVNMNGTTGFFSWANIAKINHITDTIVNVTKNFTASNNEIFITYANGTHIFHDPKIGVAGILNALIVSGGGGSSSSSKKKSEAIPGFEIPIIVGVSTLTVIAIIYELKKNKKKSVFT